MNAKDIDVPHLDVLNKNDRQNKLQEASNKIINNKPTTTKEITETNNIITTNYQKNSIVPRKIKLTHSVIKEAKESEDYITKEKGNTFTVSNNINAKAIQYGILNYDISYNFETVKGTFTNPYKNKNKNFSEKLENNIYNKIYMNNFSSGTLKEVKSQIEDNYFQKCNELKAYLV